jgi:hypothetical protein
VTKGGRRADRRGSCGLHGGPQKGLPKKMTQLEVEAFFAPMGNVKSVRMRRFPNAPRDFKVARSLSM